MASLRIAAYCRVSTDKEDQLNSLEAQKRFFRQYSAQTGSCLVRIYADEGISGTKLRKRTEFLRMLQDARLGLFDRVVVKDVSRFARNTVDLLQSIRELKALGIDTHFLTANMTSLGSSEFILTIFGALAQEESANISKRVRFGKRMNAEKGRVPNLVYGYDKVPGDYFSLRVNEREAAVVQQIFTWYTQDGCGAGRIARLLNERGENSKRGNAWSQVAVSRLLHNELYTGRVINGKQEITDFLTGRRADRPEADWLVTEKPALCIVDRETFDLAQRLMTERHQKIRSAHTYSKSDWLFSSLIRCRHCGRAYRRITRTYKNTCVRWVCSTHNLCGSCGNAVTIDEQELIRTLQDYFVSVLRGRKALSRRVLEACRAQNRSGSDVPARIAALQNSIAKLKRTRAKYLDLYADDLISRDELNQKLGSVRDEAAERSRELALLQQALEPEDRLQAGPDSTFDPIEKLVDVSAMSNGQLRQLLDRIEVDKEGHVDIYLKLFSEFGPNQQALD